MLLAFFCVQIAFEVAGEMYSRTGLYA